MERPMRTVVSSAGSASSDEERDRREDAERPELAGEVGVGPLLHRLGDVLHVVGAFARGQHLLPEHRRHPERAERDHEDDDDQGEIAAGEVRLHDSGKDPGHVLSSWEIMLVAERRGVYAGDGLSPHPGASKVHLGRTGVHPT